MKASANPQHMHNAETQSLTDTVPTVDGCYRSERQSIVYRNISDALSSCTWRTLHIVMS